MSIGGRELFLYANNTGSLYRTKMAIAKNLATKKARGVYDRELAVKGWMHFANAAAKSYVKEHGSRGDKWSTTFPVVDRQYAAKEWRDWWTDQQKAGAFESLLPAKYQKASTRKGTADAFRKLGDKRGGREPRKKKPVKHGGSYRAAYFRDTVLTGPEHSHMSDAALIREAMAEARRGGIVGEYPGVPAAQLRRAIEIGEWETQQ
ncbi:hypothetical protein LCGC14_1038260 [marine sediment metagenome]|uniref:Uncharacterized protein n=1 Tax=marine sediment metagenome TaxID=412755 RepID=A0A0F9MX79_9ZZZZ